MAGRFDECDEVFERIRDIDSRISLDQSEAATAGAYVVIATWRGDDGEAAAIAQSMEGGPFPITATAVAALLRAGREDEARAHFASHTVDLSGDDWFAPFNRGMAAVVALALGEPELGAAAYRLLLPYAGMCCTAGSGNACGPIDLYLALAAAAAGEREQATRHADDAERLCEEWQIPLAARWLRDQRDRDSF
jgi:hypothetical protein